MKKRPRKAENEPSSSSLDIWEQVQQNVQGQESWRQWKSEFILNITRFTRDWNALLGPFEETVIRFIKNFDIFMKTII